MTDKKTGLEKLVEWLENEISLEFGGMDLSHGRKLGLQNSLTKARSLLAEEQSLAARYCKGKDKDCNIIKPRKSKYVKVKAWARIHGSVLIMSSNQKINETDYPCTITILRKHLEGK